MKTKIGLFAVLTALLMSSCLNSGRVLPSVTGSQFELLVVINDSSWKSTGGKLLKEMLTQEIYGLPQAEPMFDLHHCTHAAFSDVLKPARNLILAEISDKFSAPKISFTRDMWAYPQAITKITAPDSESFRQAISEHGDKIIDFFLRAERERQTDYNRSNINAQASAEIQKMFGMTLDVPKGISKITKGKDFIWIMNDHATLHQDILVYSYPYADANTFTKDYLIAKRDSITRTNIPGEIEGSYMITEKNPEAQFSEIWVNKGYCAELRGLWKVEGVGMGGPFYSHTRLDEINRRVITVDVFVFAPSRSKRNPIRQLEAVVYTAKLPQEINQLKEVSVTGEKPE
jgi:hypothetical protein